MFKLTEEKKEHTSKKNKGLKQYYIRPSFLTLNDEKTVKYHLKKSDYFGTVATLTNLLNHLLSHSEKINKKELSNILRALSNLEKDSIFLQENYTIVPKSSPIQKRKRLFQKEDLGANDQTSLEKLKELKATKKKTRDGLGTK